MPSFYDDVPDEIAYEATRYMDAVRLGADPYMVSWAYFDENWDEFIEFLKNDPAPWPMFGRIWYYDLDNVYMIAVWSFIFHPEVLENVKRNMGEWFKSLGMEY